MDKKEIKIQFVLTKEEMYQFLYLGYEVNGYELLLNIIDKNDKNYLGIQEQYDFWCDKRYVMMDILLEEYVGEEILPERFVYDSSVDYYTNVMTVIITPVEEDV